MCNGFTLRAVLDKKTSPAFQGLASVYGSYQATADTTFFFASGQSQPPVYEEQTGTRHSADLYGREAHQLWPYQSEYSGSGYGAGSWILLEERHAKSNGSSAPPWAISQNPLPGSQCLHVTSGPICFASSVTAIDPNQSIPRPPSTPQYALFAPFQVTYTNGNGMPLNISNGVLQTEGRGVFIQNLSYDTTSADVENLMRGAGPIFRCEIKTDIRTGRSRGSATVKFTTCEDATRALVMFNGTWFMNRQLTIRLDKNQEAKSDAEASTGTPSGRNEQEPIIVDGSTGSL